MSHRTLKGLRDTRSERAGACTCDRDRPGCADADRRLGGAGCRREEWIFIDQMSGANRTKERPGLTELLKYARDSDKVYCWCIDRLGRSLTDILNTVDEMTKQGIGLHSIFDGVPSSASGRLQLGLFATPAEYERESPVRRRSRASWPWPGTF
nr:recombinase family protein [Pseudarthrobacter phenanthrenivorans]